MAEFIQHSTPEPEQTLCGTPQATRPENLSRDVDEIILCPTCYEMEQEAALNRASTSTVDS